MSNYKIFNTQDKGVHTDVGLHPGEILQDELEARDIRKSLFAEQLGVKPVQV